MSKAWPSVRLGEVLKPRVEHVAIDPVATYKEVTVRLWGKGVIERGTSTGAAIVATSRYRVKFRDFVLSKIDARNGALGIVPESLDGALVSGDFPVFEANQTRLLPEYIGWLCKTAGFVESCRQASEGTTNRVRLKLDRFLSSEIPLPPLDEQQRIVAYLDALTAKITQARNLRQQATEEAAALMTTSRRAKIERYCAESVPLEDACTAIIDNLHSNPRLSETGVPCVRSPDVGFGTLDIRSAQRTNEEEYRRRTVRGEPRENDIVLVREGGGTGKCAVVQPGQRFSLGQRVMMLRPHAERIVPRFFLHQLLSPQIQEDQIAPLSKGSAAPHLNIGALRRFKLVLPPLDEQRRVVAELDALQAKVDALKRTQAESAAELDALQSAALDRAFKGEL